MNWLLIIFILMLLTPNPANAQTRVELSAGTVHYGSNDGVWYDSLSGDYENNLAPRSLMLSLSVPGWRASLVNLGNASNWAEWGAHEHAPELADPSLDRTSVAGGRGSGSVLGISIGKTWERKFGPVELGVEGGGFVYRAQWHEQAWMLKTPETLIVNPDLDYVHTSITPYIGVTARYGWAFAEARRYHKIIGGLVAHAANQVVVGVSIPFGSF